MTYDNWKTRTPDDSDERCIRDDSTECSCSRCRADEDRFWDEQSGDDAEPDEECPHCDFGCDRCSPLVSK